MPERRHLEELKAAADGLEVAAALGLRGRGKRFFCPSCQPQGGKTPDLAILDKGFRCHKCGAKGDLLKLVMFALKVDFMKAVEVLERETGQVPKGGYQSTRAAVRSDPGASVRVLDGAEGPEAPDPAVYDAFLSACRPVEGAALDFLTKEKGIAPAVIAALKVRFCGREYLDAMNPLKDRFGDAPLLAAGLLKKSKTGRLVPSFWHYYAKKAGFLVIPYLDAGRPVYLKARPPVGKDKAAALGLVRFLNTAARVPCLYNVDALKGHPDRVLVCEGESDTWTALTHGFAAVGSPGARAFKDAWVALFRGFTDKAGRSTVYLVPDADKGGEEGSRIIADLFLKAGLPVPLKVIIPDGKDLNEYMKGGMTP